MVEIADAVGLDGCHGEAAFTLLDDKTLPLEELKGVAHRLTRNRQPFSQLILRQPLAGGEGAVGNRIDHPQMHLLDQVGDGRQRFHFELFRIPNSEC